MEEVVKRRDDPSSAINESWPGRLMVMLATWGARSLADSTDPDSVSPEAPESILVLRHNRPVDPLACLARATYSGSRRPLAGCRHTPQRMYIGKHKMHISSRTQDFDLDKPVGSALDPLS